MNRATLHVQTLLCVFCLYPVITSLDTAAALLSKAGNYDCITGVFVCRVQELNKYREFSPVHFDIYEISCVGGFPKNKIVPGIFPQFSITSFCCKFKGEK